MTPLEVIDIGRDALWLLIKVSAPLMIVALIVGLSISLIQALTQIQEQTLTFVPKIVAIFFTLMLVLPYMFESVKDYTIELMDRIADPERVADIPIEGGERNDKLGGNAPILQQKEKEPTPKLMDVPQGPPGQPRLLKSKPAP